jgi:hypothetical protein
MEGWDGKTKGSTAAFIAAYGLWALTMVVAFATCITWHGALIQLYATLGLNKWGVSLYNYAVIIVLVMGWLVFVLAAESVYRRAADEGKLIRRSTWMLGILIVLTALGMVIGRVG